MIIAITQLPNAPVNAPVEFKPTIVKVQTEALGLSAEGVEQLITVPLEQDLLNGIAFQQDIESASLPVLGLRVVDEADPPGPFSHRRDRGAGVTQEVHANPERCSNHHAPSDRLHSTGGTILE